ncbi:MAG: hypothetical protein HFH41_04410 [Lachnospiraceae bacterium]|nr:hypothetical protein [Lachnospiraceae bacterium]
MKNVREKEPETTAEKKPKMESLRNLRDHDSRQRRLMLAGMAAFGILECVFAGTLRHQEKDRMAVLVFFGIFYTVVFLAGMEFYRLQEDRFYEKAGNYKKIAQWYFISCVAAVLLNFLPEYARPVLLFSLGMRVITNSFFGMMAGVFHVTVLSLCGQENIYILLCDIFLLIGGCLAVTFFEKNENQRWGIIFLFFYTFVSIFLFSFVQTGQLNGNVLIYGVCNGIFSSIGAAALYQKLCIHLDVSRKQALERILKEDFGLVQAVWNFSHADYAHAKKVAELSAGCAILVGADPNVAAAGGFYYRLGRMEGEPYVENGVALARSNHLPREIVAILQEYNGEQKLPSTVESAIVHIVDSVVAKFEILDKTTLSSSWNQDILVYQTLNDNSATGLYDESGFSMNMFLKIRDYLVKEAKLF